MSTAVSSNDVNRVAVALKKIKKISILIANMVLEMSNVVEDDSSTLIDDFIHKFVSSQSDDESDSVEDGIAPSPDEAKVVVGRAILKLSKVPRSVIADLGLFQNDVLKGRDYISSHSSRYPFLASVYTGDYYDLKGAHALESLLDELRRTREVFEDDDEIVEYAYVNCGDLYKDTSD